MFFSVPMAPALSGDSKPGNCISSRFLRWFFAVFTTSLESQAIKAPEGARALFIAAAEIWCCLSPARAAEIGLIWIMRLRVLLSITEALVRFDGVKVEPCVYGGP